MIFTYFDFMYSSWTKLFISRPCISLLSDDFISCLSPRRLPIIYENAMDIVCMLSNVDLTALLIDDFSHGEGQH